jgi:hypothetical protein
VADLGLLTELVGLIVWLAEWLTDADGEEVAFAGV